jgi:acyl carrier protein
VIADINWSSARAHLPVLNTPTYSRLGGDEKASDAQSESALDLRDLTTRLGPDQARRAVADILVEEIARILRLPREEVSRTKPLAEIGLDSLMGVELMLGLETRFAMDAPLGSSAGGFNVADLAGHLLSMSQQDDQNIEVAEALAKRHLDKAEWGDIAPLITALREQSVDLSGAVAPSASA